MVTSDTLLALKRANPFVPFRLHLTDGRVLEVPDYFAFLVGRRDAVIGLFKPGWRKPYPSSFAFVGYDQMERVETLDTDSPLVVPANR